MELTIFYFVLRSKAICKVITFSIESRFLATILTLKRKIMNDFRYVQLYSILNSLYTLVTSHSATNYSINLFNNNIDIFTCQVLYAYILTYCILHFELSCVM